MRTITHIENGNKIDVEEKKAIRLIISGEYYEDFEDYKKNGEW